MPLEILLVNPGGREAIYQGLGRDLTAIEPSLWARLIAGYLLDRGHSVGILDAEAQNLAPEGVAAMVANAAPRMVGMVVFGHQPSASTQQMVGALAACAAIRRRSPDIEIAIMGGHVSALPERTLAEAAVDYAIDGEGPMSLDALLRGDGPLAVPGLVWRDGVSVRRNLPAPLIDVADLHGDVWGTLPMALYRAHNWQCFDGSPRQPYAAIYTSLGCPYKCHFCCINAPFHANRYRMRSPTDVVEEVRKLYRIYGVRTLKIVDEMFVLNERHYGAICEGLAALSFADELNIWAYARIDTVKADKLALLRRAGIRWLALGIESGSAHVRDGAEKHLNQDDIRDVVRTIREAGINVIGNFIFGLPDDTLDSMKETLALAKELNCEFANFYSAMAYPGSRLFDEADLKDLPRLWSGYSQHSRDCTPLPTATLSSADVLRFRDDAFHDYFSDPAYLDMVERKFGVAAVNEVTDMTARRLDRELLTA